MTVDHTPSRPGSSIFTPVALRSKIGLSIRRSALARTVRFVSLFVASDTPTGHLALWNFGRYPSSCRAQSLCRTCARMKDEPRRVSNSKGTLSFASSGKDSRQTQVGHSRGLCRCF